MPLRRRRTGDPSNRSSNLLLPRTSVSLGDLQELLSTPFVYPDRSLNRAGRVLPPYLRRQGLVTWPRASSRVRGYGGNAPIKAYSALFGRLPYQTPRRSAEGKRRSISRSSTPPLAKQPLFVRVPLRVGFCVRRKARREVLFALRRAGYGGSAPKRHYRRTQDSQWRC